MEGKASCSQPRSWCPTAFACRRGHGARVVVVASWRRRGHALCFRTQEAAVTHACDAKSTERCFGGMAAVLRDGCCCLCWCCRRTPPLCWEEGGSTATGGTLWQRAGDGGGTASIRKGVADDDDHDCRLWQACVFMFVLCVGCMVGWRGSGKARRCQACVVAITALKCEPNQA